MNGAGDIESRLGLRRSPAPGWKRLRLTVAYCGTPWRGWQSQADGNGIQDQIEAAIRKATGIRTRVLGSGRTDAGVHALGQVAHCDVPESVRLDATTWMRAINARMPLTIRIMESRESDPAFHARFDAVGKVYRYRIWRAVPISPFEADRVWHLHGDLDLEALSDCVSRLVGTHNFVRLSANRGDLPEIQRRALPEKTTRTIRRAEVDGLGDALEIEIEGDGFLYKMVRMIVGSLVQVARGRATREWFADLLGDPAGPQSHQTAPAGGLYLVRVLYPDDPGPESGVP